MYVRNSLRFIIIISFCQLEKLNKVMKHSFVNQKDLTAQLGMVNSLRLERINAFLMKRVSILPQGF